MLNKLAEATGAVGHGSGRSPHDHAAVEGLHEQTSDPQNVVRSHHGHSAVEGLPDQPGDPHDVLLHSYWARPESIHHDPSEEMPEHSMPAASAKSMVLDILELDMNPRLNLAGWLTTLMEPEGEEVIQKALYINAIDALEYPSASKAAQRCVNMLGALWSAPSGFVGTDTVYDYLTSKLEETGHFEILSTGDLPVVAFRLKGDRNYDEFDLMHRLKEHRFLVPAYKMAADLQHISLLRACIRQGFDMEMAESLVEALGHVIEWLDAHGAPPKKEGEGGMGSGGGGKHGVAEE